MQESGVAILFGAALSFWLGPAFSQGLPTRPFYECEVVNIKSLGDDGSIETTDYTRAIEPRRQIILFNETPGTLRWQGETTSWSYEVVQTPSDDNGLVAIRQAKGPASTVVQVMRIKTYIEGWPFLFLDQDTLFSGRCHRR